MGGTSFTPPQKISKALVTHCAKITYKRTFITTFAASGDILKGCNPLRLLFAVLFAEAKSTKRINQSLILLKIK